MKRNKEWWNRLSKEERSYLVYLERSQGSTRSDYLPDDCSECGACGNPTLGHGWCHNCCEDYKELIEKANGGLK